MKTKLIPQFNEGMPREVAVSILTEPRAKLTNAFRKTCKRALEKHFLAPPLQPAPPGTDLLRKWHGASLAQLLKWSRRCSARRAVAQRVYTKLNTNDWPKGMTAAKAKRIQAVLELRVNAFDNMLDNIEDELRVRSRICAAVDKAHVLSRVPPFTRANRENLTAIRLDTQRKPTH